MAVDTRLVATCSEIPFCSPTLFLQAHLPVPPSFVSAAVCQNRARENSLHRTYIVDTMLPDMRTGVSKGLFPLRVKSSLVI